MPPVAATAFARRLGATVARLSGSWYGRHMAAADRAVRARLPLVDLVLDVRDARAPIASSLGPLRRWAGYRNRVVVLNKADLADRLSTEKWIEHMKHKYSGCSAVNAHNKESVQQLLNTVRTRISEMMMMKSGESGYTGTVLVAGVPNVGKSAIVNAMHQIGRISAAEKGKLKHAAVSSYPGETKEITGYKVFNNPNIYAFDTPGVLSPKILDHEVAAKLSLSGAFEDPLLPQQVLAEFFLAIFNSSGVYRSWNKLNAENVEKKRRQYPSDHTQDFVVMDARRALFDTGSAFEGDLANEDDLARLIEIQLMALQQAFRLSSESNAVNRKAVARKVLDLYRTGRLGHYTLDQAPHIMQ